MVFATESYPLAQSLRPQASRAQSVQVVIRADGDRPNRKIVTLQKSAAQPALRLPPSTLPLPSKPKLPLGLQLLNRVQQGSAAIAGLLITGALVVYGSTAYIDKSTSYTLAQLDALQSESQQLTSANEAIKQSLAEQAEQADSGLALPKSGDLLFLAPEPPRETPLAPAEPATKRTRPLGY